MAEIDPSNDDEAEVRTYEWVVYVVETFRYLLRELEISFWKRWLRY